MATEAKKRLSTTVSVFAISQYFIKIITELESDSDSESDEDLVQELINIERDLRIRGKMRKPARVEGYMEHIIPRFSAKQFKEHFRMEPAVFNIIENRLGLLLLKQDAIGRSTVPVRKQLLATLWLLATPDSYRLILLFNFMVLFCPFFIFCVCV